MSAVVLDASAGVEIALQSAVGRRLQVRIPPGSTTWVPEHYFAEAIAVLRRLANTGSLDPARVQLALDRLLASAAVRVSVRPLVPEAWAMRHNLTIGDALYVVVASHLGAPLVTTDQRLANAPTLPVPTITP